MHSAIAQISPIYAVIASCSFYVFYLLSRSIYRLYFSPLAKFPGSPWAAVTEYWESWHNLGSGVGKQGQCLFILEKMHRNPKYGSAIRLGPNEIHIYDPRFFHQLYSLNTRYYKDPEVHKMLGAPSSTVAEVDPVLHRRRRGALESLFSRQSILKLEPMLMEKIDLACARFDEVTAQGRRIMVEYALKSLTIDMVSEFSFGKSLGALHNEDFTSGPVLVFRNYLHSLHLIKTFPFLRKFAQSIPLWLAKRINKTIEMSSELEKFANQRIESFITAFNAGQRPEFPTVMERLLTPNAKKDFDVPDNNGLRDEILTLISAGNDTTGITSMTGLFYVLQNPSIQERLLAELKTVLPQPDSVASYLDIEKLPYLTAVLNESLRYASAAASRTPRLVPAGGVTLPDGRFIPGGTRVGMSIYCLHFNEDIFPQPHVFAPERWLEGEHQGELGDLETMHKYLVPFSKGTRGCLGINLAYMELYLIMAYLFRRFEFQTDTTPEEMKWDDMIVPLFHGTFEVVARRRTE